MSLKFKLRDLSVACYFLGIEIQPTNMDLMLRQHKYTLNILHRVSMSSCKPIDTLASSSKLDMITDSLFSDSTCFCQIVGALQYLTFMRSNICYFVNKVCQFMYAPTNVYWVVVKCIFGYLNGTHSYGLYITRSSSLSLNDFIDVDSVNDHKLTSAYLVYFNITHIF